MKHLHFTVPVLIALVVIGVVSTLLWFRSPLFGAWARNQYFGKVIELRENTLLLEGKHTETISISYDQYTRIMKGSHAVGNSELRINTPVIVIAEPDADGKLHAKAIRIFAPKKPYIHEE